MTPRMRRVALAAVSLAVGAFAFASAAAALPILAPEDAEGLAESLAEATEAQGICYGWDVSVDDQNGGGSGNDIGGSLGAGTPVINRFTGASNSCERYVIFTASITYTSNWSESEDYASYSIVSNLSPAPTTSQLGELGLSERDLLGDNDDVAISNAVLALPALVAELGHAPPVPLEEDDEPLAAGEEPTNRPGSDWLRKNAVALGAAVALLVIGVLWIGFAVLVNRTGMNRPNFGGVDE